MMGGPLAGLSEHLTLAREYALLGNYDTALIFFDGVVAQINKYALHFSVSLIHLSCLSVLFVLGTFSAVVPLIFFWGPLSHCRLVLSVHSPSVGLVDLKAIHADIWP